MAKKKQYKKKQYKKKAPITKALSTGTHRFTRYADYPDTIITVPLSGGTVYSGKGYSFSLDYLPDYTDFTTLYDSFSIDAVKMYFSFNGNSLLMSDKYYTVGLPENLFLVDYDDYDAPASTLAGWKSIQQCNNVKYFQVGNKSKSRYAVYLVPRVAGMAYETLTTTAYTAMKPKTQIDMKNSATPHYGLKWMCKVPHVAATGHDTEIRVSVMAKYFITCKHPR